MVCAALLIVFGGQLERAVLSWVNINSMAWPWLSRLTRYLVAFGTTVAVLSSLYYFGPYRQQRWNYVWPGAILATVLWLLSTSGFAWYARNIAHYNVMYGSVGAGIALLVWMYLSAIIALIGCEFNAEYERSVR
jgi:membrane protein